MEETIAELRAAREALAVANSNARRSLATQRDALDRFEQAAAKAEAELAELTAAEAP